MPERAKGVRVSLGKQKEVGEPREKKMWFGRIERSPMPKFEGSAFSRHGWQSRWKHGRLADPASNKVIISLMFPLGQAA